MQQRLIIGLVVLTLSLFLAGFIVGLNITASRLDDPVPDKGAEIVSPGHEDADPGEIEPDPEPEPEPDLRVASIALAGDITAHLTQIIQAHLSDGTHDFSPSFDIIAPYLQAADLAIGDLETCQAGPEISFFNYQGYTAYPCFNAPLELSMALKDAGFDLLATANNHSLDRGLSGLKETLTNVRSLGLITFGTYLSPEEQQTPVIIDVNGIKIAFLSYTFSTNGIPVPKGHEYAVNVIDNFHTVDPIIDEIAHARASGADLITIYMHWGEMYVTEPQPQRLRTVAKDLATAGADLIIGGHPHVVQPMEWFYTERQDGSLRSTLTTYSLGNFISNQHYPANPTDLVEYGVLLHVDVTKDMNTGETWLSSVDYDITWVHRGWRHRILPLSLVLAAEPSEFRLTRSDIDRLTEGKKRNIDIIERYGFSRDAPEGILQRGGN